MQELVILTGMILKVIPIGDYDKRLTILTKERGKVSAFAKGTRRQNSRLMAATNPFSFGEFKLYEGRSSYNVADIHISNYFESLRDDFEAAYYGMYFLEVADYYTRENNDEKDMLKLLYQTMRALTNYTIENQLIQYIFEMKTLVVNGEFPGIPENKKLLGDTRYTIEYIVNTPIERLYNFVVSVPVLEQLAQCADIYRTGFIGHNFKSLEILENCRLKK